MEEQELRTFISQLMHEIESLKAQNEKLREIHRRDLECLINMSKDLERLKNAAFTYKHEGSY